MGLRRACRALNAALHFATTLAGTNVAPKVARTHTPMQSVLSDYFPILVFIVIAMAVSGAMLGASLLAGQQKPYPEKVAAYECGFDAFDDARRRFDVRFYLVAILFIIFDLEVAFLFPWAVSLGRIGLFGFLSMLGFLGVLTVGFVYEWCKGALDWE